MQEDVHIERLCEPIWLQQETAMQGDCGIDCMAPFLGIDRCVATYDNIRQRLSMLLGSNKDDHV